MRELIELALRPDKHSLPSVKYVLQVDATIIHIPVLGEIRRASERRGVILQAGRNYFCISRRAPARERHRNTPGAFRLGASRRGAPAFTASARLCTAR